MKIKKAKVFEKSEEVLIAKTIIENMNNFLKCYEIDSIEEFPSFIVVYYFE